MGLGDASPLTVNSALGGAELRIAETRAVNRALRKAYGIGICSLEETGSSAKRESAIRRAKAPDDRLLPRLRDRLLLLIHHEVHHRKRRSQGGADREANLITLCAGCHRQVHRGGEL